MNWHELTTFLHPFLSLGLQRPSQRSKRICEKCTLIIKQRDRDHFSWCIEIKTSKAKNLLSCIWHLRQVNTNLPSSHPSGKLLSDMQSFWMLSPNSTFLWWSEQNYNNLSGTKHKTWNGLNGKLLLRLMTNVFSWYKALSIYFVLERFKHIHMLVKQK